MLCCVFLSFLDHLLITIIIGASVAYLIFFGRTDDTLYQMHILFPVLQTALLFRRACIIFRGRRRRNQCPVGALVDEGVLYLVRPGRANFVEDTVGGWGVTQRPHRRTFRLRGRLRNLRILTGRVK